MTGPLTQWVETTTAAGASLLDTGVRAVVVYLLGIAAVRLGKSRLFGRVAGVDILVGLIIGSLLSRGITGDAGLGETFAATAAILVVHWACTRLAVYSHLIGALTKGNCVPLIERGVLRSGNLTRCHLSENDLLQALRLNGIDDLADVAHAFKERNGEISIIKKQHSLPGRDDDECTR